MLTIQKHNLSQSMRKGSSCRYSLQRFKFLNLQTPRYQHRLSTNHHIAKTTSTQPSVFSNHLIVKQKDLSGDHPNGVLNADDYYRKGLPISKEWKDNSSFHMEDLSRYSTAARKKIDNNASRLIHLMTKQIKTILKDWKSNMDGVGFNTNQILAQITNLTQSSLQTHVVFSMGTMAAGFSSSPSPSSPSLSPSSSPSSSSSSTLPSLSSSFSLHNVFHAEKLDGYGTRIMNLWAPQQKILFDVMRYTQIAYWLQSQVSPTSKNSEQDKTLILLSDLLFSIQSRNLSGLHCNYVTNLISVGIEHLQKATAMKHNFFNPNKILSSNSNSTSTSSTPISLSSSPVSITYEYYESYIYYRHVSLPAKSSGALAFLRGLQSQYQQQIMEFVTYFSLACQMRIDEMSITNFTSEIIPEDCNQLISSPFIFAMEKYPNSLNSKFTNPTIASWKEFLEYATTEGIIRTRSKMNYYIQRAYHSLGALQETSKLDHTVKPLVSFYDAYLHLLRSSSPTKRETIDAYLSMDIDLSQSSLLPILFTKLENVKKRSPSDLHSHLQNFVFNHQDEQDAQMLESA